MPFVGDFAIENAPKHHAAQLSTFPKSRKAAVCLMEKTQVLGKFRLGLSYSALDLELNVNESPIFIE